MSLHHLHHLQFQLLILHQGAHRKKTFFIIYMLTALRRIDRKRNHLLPLILMIRADCGLHATAPLNIAGGKMGSHLLRPHWSWARPMRSWSGTLTKFSTRTIGGNGRRSRRRGVSEAASLLRCQPSRQKPTHRFAESGHKSGYIFELCFVFASNTSILVFSRFNVTPAIRGKLKKCGSFTIPCGLKRRRN